MNNNKLLVLGKEGIELHAIRFERDEAFEAIRGVFLIFGRIPVMTNHQGLGLRVVKMRLWDRTNLYRLNKTRLRDTGRLAKAANRRDNNRGSQNEKFHRDRHRLLRERALVSSHAKSQLVG